MATAPPNANAASSPPQGGGAVTSLMAALNKKQQQLVASKIIDYADEYSIEFAPAWLGDSKLRKPGNVDYTKTSMAPPTGGLADPQRTTPNPDIFSRSFDAGQSIAFVINRIMMESSYVYEQQSVIIDKNGNPQANGKSAQYFAWYNILCFAVPTDKWDTRRKDWAYKIKYVVVPYETPVVSEYFPNGQFRGAHKNYNYWFTGQNKEVLHYEVVNNNAYYNVINTPTAGTRFKNQFNSYQIVRSAPQARSQESDQGAAERVNDIAANAADWLYNAVDYNEIRLRILGDPAWINAENFASQSDVSFSPFRDDGSINFSTGPAYFTINYNIANDYNIDTGLMNIQGSATVQNLDGTISPGPAVSFNYTAVECRSSFRQGRFEQELVGRLRLGAASDILSRDRSGTRPAVDSRVAGGTSSVAGAAVNAAASALAQQVRQPNIEVLQGPVANVINNLTNQTRVRFSPVLIPGLNLPQRENVTSQPFQPGIINVPVPSGQDPNTNSGQDMNRDE
jgi:hypothetical protein